MRRDRKLRLGEDLIARGLVDQEQLHEALTRHHATGERLGEALVSLQHLSRSSLWEVLGAGWVDLASEPCDVSCLALLSRSTLRRCQAVPVRLMEGGKLLVAMVDPFNVVYVDEMWRESGRAVEACAADPAMIARALAETEQGRPDRERHDRVVSIGQTPPSRQPDREEYRSVPLSEGMCDACGGAARADEGILLHRTEFSRAWPVAARVAEATSGSPHSVMARWQDSSAGVLRLCAMCQAVLSQTDDYLCAMCNRPTHDGEGSVVGAVDEEALSQVSEEMGLRRRICRGCGRAYCLSCGTRHGWVLGSNVVLCPFCSAPSET